MKAQPRRSPRVVCAAPVGWVIESTGIAIDQLTGKRQVRPRRSRPGPRPGFRGPRSRAQAGLLIGASYCASFVPGREEPHRPSPFPSRTAVPGQPWGTGRARSSRPRPRRPRMWQRMAWRVRPRRSAPAGGPGRGSDVAAFGPGSASPGPGGRHLHDSWLHISNLEGPRHPCAGNARSRRSVVSKTPLRRRSVAGRSNIH